jgi:hypothetical protein
MPFYEVYKMVVHGAPGSNFNVYVDNNLWDSSIAGDDNSWDPNEPLQMRPGETLYFFYSDFTSDLTPPTATIWLRYDQDNLANQNSGQIG